MRHVHNQIFQHEHEHQWGHNRLVIVLGDGAETGQVVATINVHGATAADALSAGAAEGQGRIDLVLDLDQGIEHHGSTLLHVDVVGHILGLVVGIIRVRPVDVKLLHVFLFLSGKALVKLNGVVDFEHISDVSETGCNWASESSRLREQCSGSVGRSIDCGL